MNASATTRPHPQILLAEDDRALRELLAFCLVRAGYSVVSCDNGRELLAHLQRRPHRHFDLILTDLRMPGIGGLEVLGTLHDRSDRPPVICMTAFGDAATHRAAHELGATVTIDKPFDLDALIALIGRFCPLPAPRHHFLKESRP